MPPWTLRGKLRYSLKNSPIFLDVHTSILLMCGIYWSRIACCWWVNLNFSTAPPSGYYIKHKANFDKISLVLMHQGKSFHGRHYGESKLQKAAVCYYSGRGVQAETSAVGHHRAAWLVVWARRRGRAERPTHNFDFVSIFMICGPQAGLIRLIVIQTSRNIVASRYSNSPHRL